MAGDHTSASSDSSIKVDVGVLSAGITIRVRRRERLLLDDPDCPAAKERSEFMT